MRTALVLYLGAVVLSGCAGSGRTVSERDIALSKASLAILDIAAERSFSPHSGVDSVFVGNDSVEVFLNEDFANAPIREQMVSELASRVRRALGKRFQGRDVVLYSRGSRIESLVPNVFRERQPIDDSRLTPATTAESGSEPIIYSGSPVVTYPNSLERPSAGLFGRHIALWPSHGWYYEPALDRWEWQRARIFQTVEDKLPLSFVLKYLVPMLENAGSEVYLPRERDTQHHMVIVDHDGSSGQSQYAELASGETGFGSAGPGFALGTMPYEDAHNPFRAGLHRVLPAAAEGPASVMWVPEIPVDGQYAVYLSYGKQAEACAAATYFIRHGGGETPLLVDQSRGAGTWIYAGSYQFASGRSQTDGAVVLTNDSAENCTLSADAVRFGGGTGVIRRGESTSRRPRYLEAARYHLQFAGAPDSLVYDLSNEIEDYRDDYRSRGEWVNWLRGAPFGPNKDRESDGLNIPIDAALAFHTDAGIAGPDSSIGTLLIYSSTALDSARSFPDGMSRMANRDLADILQTQIVEDVRVKYDPDWRRRALWDREYSEAVRPNVPSALLELLSHQNFHDMRYGLDPRFQFDTARSMYKGLLRFLSVQHGTEYVVQPLPINHFSVTLEDDSAVLSWQGVEDPLEPTAGADRYIVQRRVGDDAWDQGVVVRTTSARIPVDSTNTVYSFRVAAVNDGGRSMSSEVLSVGRAAGQPVRIIDAFDRVSAPASFMAGEVGGFASWIDQGVPDGFDISYTGPQFNFDVAAPWLDDDAPGFGASHAAFEASAIAGNTRNFSGVHGRALLDAGYSFDSISDEAVIADSTALDGYRVVNVLLGEEKATFLPKSDVSRFKSFTDEMQHVLRRYQARGGALLASGAYVGTDLSGSQKDSTFAAEVLRFRFRTGHASTTGSVYGVRNRADIAVPEMSFVTDLNSRQYAVEAPDAIEPVADGIRFMRYRDTNMSAAVAHSGPVGRTVVFGFPIESVTTAESRSALMTAAMSFLTADHR